MKLVRLEKVQLEDCQPLAAGTTADSHSKMSVILAKKIDAGKQWDSRLELGTDQVTGYLGATLVLKKERRDARTVTAQTVCSTGCWTSVDVWEDERGSSQRKKGERKQLPYSWMGWWKMVVK